jgi:hypothetical protein
MHDYFLSAVKWYCYFSGAGLFLLTLWAILKTRKNRHIMRRLNNGYKKKSSK